MDEYFLAWFPLLPCVLPGLAHRADNFVRGVYSVTENLKYQSSLLCLIPAVITCKAGSPSAST